MVVWDTFSIGNVLPKTDWPHKMDNRLAGDWFYAGFRSGISISILVTVVTMNGLSSA
jgi:hypothetical protein